MKKILIAMAAVASLGLSVNEASAQFPPPPVPKSGVMQANGWGAGPVASPYGMPAYGGQPQGAEPRGDRYGLHPVLKRLFHIRDAGCNNGNCARGGNPGPYGPMQMNPATGGTLAFPQHPFVRSPRDFFDKD